MPPSSEVLDVTAREITSAQGIVYDVQMKPLVRSVPVTFKSGPRKTLEEAHTAVNAAYGSSSRFPGLSDDIPVVEDEDVEEDPAWYLCDLTSKNDRGPFASLLVQALCREYGLSVPNDS